MVGALASENPHVDVFAGNVTEDNTGNNDLSEVSLEFRMELILRYALLEWRGRMQPSS
jgi:hypothetical protein